MKMMECTPQEFKAHIEKYGDNINMAYPDFDPAVFDAFYTIEYRLKGTNELIAYECPSGWVHGGYFIPTEDPERDYSDGLAPRYGGRIKKRPEEETRAIMQTINDHIASAIPNIYNRVPILPIEGIKYDDSLHPNSEGFKAIE